MVEPKRNGMRSERGRSRLRLAARGLALVVFLAGNVAALSAAVDPARLPPASTNRVDFVRDIQPLLEQRCLQCHGPEKPKSGFRIDSRAALLRGGANGVAVVPGRSGESPLIHFVAGLVEDMEMPPRGKGDPLTATQIGLLRAWIDQDLPWGGPGTAAQTRIQFEPGLRWVNLRGDEHRFREQQWMREGWDGGLERLELEQRLDERVRFHMTARALRDDYQVGLGVNRENSFLRGGFEQWRRYYDDSGGYYAPFRPPQLSLDDDLHLDLGRLWFEGGLTAPFGTRFEVGYEYRYREGDKSLTAWLPYTQGGVTRNIYPNARQIDELVQILRFEVEHEWETFRLADQFHYEFTDLNTRETLVTPGQDNLSTTLDSREGNEINHLANALSFEKQLRDWLLFSGGYLYTHANGEASYDHSAVGANGQPAGGSYWTGEGITLRQDAHVLNLNGQAGPWQGFTVTAGAQAEWNDQESFGPVSLDVVIPGDVPPRTANPATVTGEYQRFITQERAGVRYTRIPFTVLYGEANWRQESLDQSDGLLPENSGTPGAYSREADISRNWQRYRTGFDVSPWSRVSLNAWYQFFDRHTDFDQDVVDLQNLANPGPLAGYPGFLRAQDIETDEVGARLVWRPANWLKTTLAYRLVATDYRNDTASVSNVLVTVPGGPVQAGNYDAHVYSLNFTLTPWRRLHLFTSVAMEDARTETADQDSGAIVPYRGRTWSALVSGHYALNDRTGLNVSYNFSHADFEQDNVAEGLPLGIDYQWHTLRAGFSRELNSRMRVRLEYFFSLYDEPSSAGLNDYTAQGVFATFAFKWQ